MVVPSALKVLRLRARRKFAVVSRLSHEVGWKYQNVIQTLEAKRKLKSKRFYEKKRQVEKFRLQAKTQVADKIAPYQKIIESYGYK